MTPPQARWETTDRWHRTFPGKREQVREARRFIRAHLPHHPDAELIASELVTNAVEHTRTGEPGGVFTALIRRRPDGTAYLVPHQATFALSTMARRRWSLAWRLRQMM